MIGINPTHLPEVAAGSSVRGNPAEQLERAFLEEMLKYCGPKPMSGAFSGGAGEDHFGSFLTREHAAILARQVDLGFDRFLSRGGSA
ncbi:hypothetical protein KY389_10000 [Paracoccus bogoriensis]|uniref:hypothetical protein n=1 Tax=Paracoccus bogoriensis TaxID=242065 RepID=UPI001CA5A8E3|nr:hypothetical protein [Paracoccus bogoriensis]MBW7057021.1 hypothetical protein [Paracoccus bogoriensis]